MFLLYNLLFLLILPGILLYSYIFPLFTHRHRKKLSPRLGLGLKSHGSLRTQKVIWVHATSVGEVLAAVPLIWAMQEELPAFRIAVSTTTDPGMQIARRKLESLGCHFFYLPLDLYIIVRRVVKFVGPSLFVLIESDMWPSLLRCLRKQGARTVLVNGRLSDRSFARYLRLRRFSDLTLGTIDIFCMQNEEYALRMQVLGIEETKIRVTGNLKFDQPLLNTVSEEREELIQELGWTPPRFTWVAGSTHPGEEDIILKVYSRLRQRFPELCLILAPRKPDRFDEVFMLAKLSGWRTTRRSQLPVRRGRADMVDVLILDTIGELARFYSLGSFAFLGGSLFPFGGQNPLEAAQRGLPVIFGPHMQDFREVAKILMQSGGGFQAANETDLFAQVETWLVSPEACREQGEKARTALILHQGAVARSMEVIRGLLGAESENP